MDKEIIEKIGLVLKEQIKKSIRHITDNEIYNLFNLYMPYIDEDNGGDKDIVIKRENESLLIHFRIEEESYLIDIVIY